MRRNSMGAVGLVLGSSTSTSPSSASCIPSSVDRYLHSFELMLFVFIEGSVNRNARYRWLDNSQNITISALSPTDLRLVAPWNSSTKWRRSTRSVCNSLTDRNNDTKDRDCRSKSPSSCAFCTNQSRRGAESAPSSPMNWSKQESMSRRSAESTVQARSQKESKSKGLIIHINPSWKH